MKPYRIKLSLTNECNYNCDYCFLHYDDKEKSSLEKWKKYIKIIYDKLIYNKYNKVKVCITGGEPTIVPYFNELIEFIIDFFKDYNLELTITTNFTNRKKLIKTLDIIPNDVYTNINLSWHSSESKILFKEFQNRTLEISKDYNKIHFSILFMLEHTDKCLAEIKEITKYPDNVEFFKLPIIGHDEYYKKYSLDIFEINIKEGNINMTEEAPTIINSKNLVCNAIIVSSYIKSNGDYFPCPNCNINDSKIGNLNNEETIQKIDKYIKFGAYICQYQKCNDYFKYFKKQTIKQYSKLKDTKDKDEKRK